MKAIESHLSLKERVLKFMLGNDAFDFTPTNSLREIPLGLLRISSIRRHAVCRYKAGITKGMRTGPADVKEICLHPISLYPEWIEYGEFLLYHEYIHALGLSNHGPYFRYLESLWPNNKVMIVGSSFSQHLVLRNSKWLWSCMSCGFNSPRSIRNNSRYACSLCNIVLVDLPYTIDHEAKDFGVSLT